LGIREIRGSELPYLERRASLASGLQSGKLIAPDKEVQCLMENETDLDSIKRMLLQTGFPLELQISDILNRRGYEVQGNPFYEDEGKIREVDMVALSPILRTPKSEDEWVLNPSVAIECKMSKELSWVFYKGSPIEAHSMLAQGIDALLLRHGSAPIASVFPSLHYWTDDVAFTCTVIHPKKGRAENNNEIFQPASQLSNYINYELSRLKPFYDDTRHDIIFYFPIVVFDGLMYLASYDSRGLAIKPIGSVVMERRIVSSVTGLMTPMYIDIVTRTRFEEHMSMIEKEIKSAETQLAKKRTQSLLTRSVRTRLRGPVHR
jgi:hypothetical protein